MLQHSRLLRQFTKSIPFSLVYTFSIKLFQTPQNRRFLSDDFFITSKSSSTLWKKCLPSLEHFHLVRPTVCTFTSTEVGNNESAIHLHKISVVELPWIKYKHCWEKFIRARSWSTADFAETSILMFKKKDVETVNQNIFKFSKLVRLPSSIYRTVNFYGFSLVEADAGRPQEISFRKNIWPRVACSLLCCWKRC